MQHISTALQHAQDQAADAMRVELWQQHGPQQQQPAQQNAQCPFYDRILVNGIISGFSRNEAAERAEFFTNQEKAKQHGEYTI